MLKVRILINNLKNSWSGRGGWYNHPMNTKDVGVENRKFMRVPFKCPVKYRLNEFDVFSGELAQDLSIGGLRLRCNTFIPLHASVKVRAQFSPSSEVLDLEGNVVWIRSLPYSDAFQIGLKFNEEALSRSRIAQYILSAS